jgi:hypothetical protein
MESGSEMLHFPNYLDDVLLLVAYFSRFKIRKLFQIKIYADAVAV